MDTKKIMFSAVCISLRTDGKALKTVYLSRTGFFLGRQYPFAFRDDGGDDENGDGDDDGNDNCDDEHDDKPVRSQVK